MSSEVDICNLGLAHLGEDPAITLLTPPTGGAHAKKAKIFYPMARNAILELHDWHFATRRKVLAALDQDNYSDDPPGELPAAWAYAYGYPSDCLKPRRLVNIDAVDDTDGADFVVETLADGTKVIFTNTVDALLVYTRVVTDTTKFTPLCELAISHMLASLLAGPILKGREGRKVAAEHLQHALLVISQAAASDSNARKLNDYQTRAPDSISARL